MKKFYITTPIYYANSDPHIGSTYTTIAADVLTRWHKLKQDDVFFLTGTDEHGQKIQQTAEEKGIKPKKFVDQIAAKFKKTFRLLDISNNNFIRTTDDYHKDEVKKVLQELYKKKFIYKGEYSSYYCIGCEQYLTKKDLVDGKCPLHKKEPALIKEESYMFKLSSFQNKLLNLIKSGKYCILPVKKRNEVLSFIKEGLQDISVSRKKSKVSWGIELPFDKEHSCYVWIDAFWSYINGLKNKKNFDKFWPPDLQLMANDILRVHATIWPALLLALDYKLPKNIFIHGYFTVDGQKMSKSLGNAIDPVYLSEKYSVDAIRYFLMREIPFGQDGDFSEEALKQRLNNELANDLGNLVSRVLSMVEKYFKGEIPKAKTSKELQSKLNLKKITESFDNLELHLVLAEIWKFINECNKFINEKRPWESKDKEETLYSLLDSLRIISILISPFIPQTSEKINKQLNLKSGLLKDCKFNLLKQGKINKKEILFKKIE